MSQERAKAFLHKTSLASIAPNPALPIAYMVSMISAVYRKETGSQRLSQSFTTKL